ncbi:MAG: RsmE family RNA methyltransferase [Huintestinicola sp.]
MARFFIDENAVMGEMIRITGGDAFHIGRSLRMRTGERITFCREGTDYECVIEKITSDEVYCKIIETIPSTSEPDLRLTIFQAFPKQDKAELIIQKCTELGASEIIFFLSKRCIARPDEKSAEKKIIRFNKIAEEAAKQSGRGIIPAVKGIFTFKDAVSMLNECEIPLFCYENGGEKISEIDFSNKKTCGVMIGSEGGFDRDEMEYAIKSGAVPIWLGKRILRCETCPIAVTSIIMNVSGNI